MVHRTVPAKDSSHTNTDPPARPVAWALLLAPAVAQFLLHILTNGRMGIFRDEYYYLACAARPAWGYVDQPPFSIWVLSVWKAVFGDSIHSIRILPALCGSGLIILAGAASAGLGGGRWAQFFAALGTAIGGVGLVICGSYSMNCFDILYWLGAYYLVIRIIRTGGESGWIGLGFVLGLGLFNKIGLLVFGLAFVLGLLSTRQRRFFADRRLYLTGAVAVLFLVPYVLWNAANDWATIEFMKNATASKISAFTPLAFLEENVLEANPVTLPLWLGGLLWLLLARRARRYRMVAVIFVATFIILVVQRSKPYYFASSFPVLMAAGGVAWEQWTGWRRVRWLRWLMTVILIAGGVLILPMAVPLLSPERTVAYGKRMGIIPAAQEVGHTSELPQYFADRLGWEELARTVSAIYSNLPEEERGTCVVWGRNYGHAGSLEYWTRRYDLPPVLCSHNNYWIWGPPADAGKVVIVVRGSREDLEHLFRSVEEAGVVETPYAIEDRMIIWVCRDLRWPIGEIWDSFKAYG